MVERLLADREGDGATRRGAGQQPRRDAARGAADRLSRGGGVLAEGACRRSRAATSATTRRRWRWRAARSRSSTSTPRSRRCSTRRPRARSGRDESAADHGGIARRGARASHAGIAAIRDELNAADRVLGDGDTGMTVAELVTAWNAAAPDLPRRHRRSAAQARAETRRRERIEPRVGDRRSRLAAAGKAAMQASRRSIAAQVAAVADLGDRRDHRAARAPRPATRPCSTRCCAVAAALRAPGGDACAAADAALVEFRSRESRLGRARMYGARTVGRDDPGMLAAARLLHASRES